ncbi:hypothetical protein ACWEPL_64900 [Nonomuraea sp. NPDC004186]
MDAIPFDRPHPLEPPPAYARLRATSPVARVLTPDGQEVWLITSYQAAAMVLSDRRVGVAPPGADTTGNDTLFQDGEAHIRLRRAVSHAFGPRALDKLVPRIEGLAEEYVRAMTDITDTSEERSTSTAEPPSSKDGLTAFYASQIPAEGCSWTGTGSDVNPNPAGTCATSRPCSTSTTFGVWQR